MFCQELAAQLARDAFPRLDDAGVLTRCVGIGTLDTARAFCDHVGFPRERLYADPENAAYTALNLNKGVAATFFTIDTPLSILRRAKEGTADGLLSATKRWKPWLPPKSDQGLQQGGAFVFQGSATLYSHFDPSTGAHVSLGEMLDVAIGAASARLAQPSRRRDD